MIDALPVTKGYEVRCSPLDEAGDALLLDWQKFYGRSASACWMHHLGWIKGYYEGQTEDVRLYPLYQSGTLVGIAPFLVRDWPLRWYLGEIELFRFPLRRLRLLGDSIGFAEDEKAYDALFGKLGAAGGEFDTLFLEGLPVESYLWKYLHSSPLIRASFVAYEPVAPSPHPVLRIQGSFEEYMGKFSSKHRKNLTRSVRQFRDGKLGSMRLERFESQEDVSRFLEDAVAVSRKTYQWIRHNRGLSATELVEKRLRFAAQQGFLRSYVLYCEDKPCSFIVGYQVAGRFLLDEIGFDPALAKYSPGTVTLLLAIEDLFNNNPPEILDMGEYGTYKEMLSTESYLQGTLYLFRPTVYAHFLRTSDRVWRYSSSAMISLMNRLHLKASLRQRLRGWAAAQ